MRWLTAALALTSCAAVPVGEGFNSCDMVAAGDYDSRIGSSGLRREDVNRGVRVALSAAGLTTDIRLGDVVENCRVLRDYRVYTKKEASFVYPYDNKTMVSGWTSCLFRTIVIGTPESGEWRDSSLVHEIFHAFQGCEGTPPEDVGTPAQGHDNWIRDGIFNAIDWARTQP